MRGNELLSCFDTAIPKKEEAVLFLRPFQCDFVRLVTLFIVLPVPGVVFFFCFFIFSVLSQCAALANTIQGGSITQIRTSEQESNSSRGQTDTKSSRAPRMVSVGHIMVITILRNAKSVPEPTIAMRTNTFVFRVQICKYLYA